MKRILFIILSLFVLSCDNGNDGDGELACPIEGTWQNISFSYVYSDECSAGEDDSSDISCLKIIVADNIVTWDSCDCGDEEDFECIHVSDDEFSCEVEGLTIEGDIATLILIESVDEFEFIDCSVWDCSTVYGDECMITSTLVFERDI